MLGHSSSSIVSIASDHEPRTKLILAFYSAYVPPGRRLYYVPRKSGSQPPAEWFIAHSPAEGFLARDEFRDPNGNHYVLERVFPFAGLSGFQWALYHHTREGG